MNDRALYIEMYEQAREYARSVSNKNNSSSDLSVKEITTVILYDMLERHRMCNVVQLVGSYKESHNGY